MRLLSWVLQELVMLKLYLAATRSLPRHAAVDRVVLLDVIVSPRVTLYAS